jgi:DNA-directed RNA polymerase subunit RPC12/RpoP
MAEGRRIVCSDCSRTIEAWDDGQPYYRDARGRKRYAYHPSPEFERCTGNDSPTLCLDCGADFLVDSARLTDRCPTCRSERIVDHWQLDGQRCPFCRTGTFETDEDTFMIS